MDDEPRPPYLRTGNTLRRPPHRSQKTWSGRKRGDGLLRFSGPTSGACSALGLPLDASVPHSLGKHGLWQLYAELKEADDHEPLVNKLHKTGHWELQRCVQLSVPEDAHSEEKLRLQVVWPPSKTQLCRAIRSRRGRRHPKTRRKSQLEIDAWKPSESDSDTSNESEAPPSPSAPTLTAFLAPKAVLPVKVKRKRKRRPKAASFPPFLPTSPLLQATWSPLSSPDPEEEEEPEHRLDLEDVVALRSVRITADSAQVASDRLRSSFGDRLWEAASTPRRFAIDVSARVRHASGLPGPAHFASGLAFLSFEVVRGGELQSELELKANVLLRPGPSEIEVPPCALLTEGKLQREDEAGSRSGTSARKIAPGGAEGHTGCGLRTLKSNDPRVTTVLIMISDVSKERNQTL